MQAGAQAADTERPGQPAAQAAARLVFCQHFSAKRQSYDTFWGEMARAAAVGLVSPTFARRKAIVDWFACFVSSCCSC